MTAFPTRRSSSACGTSTLALCRTRSGRFPATVVRGALVDAVLPIREGTRVPGRAVTMGFGAGPAQVSRVHLGVWAIEQAAAGEEIVANGAHTEMESWDGLLSVAPRLRWCGRRSRSACCRRLSARWPRVSRLTVGRSRSGARSTTIYGCTASSTQQDRGCANGRYRQWPGVQPLGRNVVVGRPYPKARRRRERRWGERSSMPGSAKRSLYRCLLGTSVFDAPLHSASRAAEWHSYALHFINGECIATVELVDSGGARPVTVAPDSRLPR